ncbi:MAG: YkgJ family cysteine cluster protein [Candidatus Omnitrophica bacterium]|nr:YkgJ family cysteine cluster protein [Candidatus Omnitrophota bacterium]
MLTEMKQFLSSDVCLSCEGCCRFDKEKSDWRPKVGESEERAIVANLTVAEKIESKKLVERGGYLSDKSCHGMHVCTFFHSDDSTCRIYHNRPFECRLYPFVLTRLRQARAVSVHLSCPYVQEKKGTLEYDQYVGYLKELFQSPEVDSLLRKNAHLFGDYSGYEAELEWVFDIKQWEKIK